MRDPDMLHPVLMPNRASKTALGIALVMLAIPVAVQACPSCVAALQGTGVGSGFNASILFLLMMPFALVGSIGGGLFFYIRRHSRPRQGQKTYGTASSTI